MKGARILAVDDETQAREILARILESKGHRVTGAGSAEEAQSLLLGASFDLILLDQVLPGISGLQALRLLAALSPAPVYLMSGYSGEELKTDAELVGAAGFLSKPLDFKAIEALIAALPDKT